MNDLSFCQQNKQPSSASEDNDQDSDEDAGSSKPPMISTNFAEWCASYFAQSVMKVNLRYKCNRFVIRPQHSKQPQLLFFQLVNYV